MKVAWLSLEWPRAGQDAGGVGRYTYRLASQLRDMVDLSVIAPHDALPLRGVQLVSCREADRAWRCQRSGQEQRSATGGPA